MTKTQDKVKLSGARDLINKSRFGKEGGSSFECSDYEGMYDDLVVRIDQALKQNTLEGAELQLYLLQGFNDYDNPLEMDAEYVRNRIIELTKEFNE